MKTVCIYIDEDIWKRITSAAFTASSEVGKRVSVGKFLTDLYLHSLSKTVPQTKIEKDENTKTRKEPVSPKPKLKAVEPADEKAERLAEVQKIAPVYPAKTFNPQPKTGDKKKKGK